MEWGLFRHLWKHSYSKGQRVVFAQGLHWNLLVLSQYVYILLYLRWKIASDKCNYMRKVSEKRKIGLKGDFSINLAFQTEACSSHCNLDFMNRGTAMLSKCGYVGSFVSYFFFFLISHFLFDIGIFLRPSLASFISFQKLQIAELSAQFDLLKYGRWEPHKR